MAEFVYIRHPQLEEPPDGWPRVTQGAFDRHWSEKGWELVQDAPAATEATSPAPLTATTTDAQVAPDEAPAPDAETAPAPDAPVAATTDQAAAEAPAKRTARTR
jgi:hypothetical protein